MIELYHHHVSVCAAKSRLALAEKGVEWSGHMMNLRASDQHQPEYLAINPFGLVPTLVHDGTVIVESTVINEYVDDVFDGPPLRPTDPVKLAQMRVWTRMNDENVHAAAGVLTTAIAYRHVPQHGEQISNQIDPFKKDRKTQRFNSGIDTPHFRVAIKRMDMLLDHMEQALSGDGPGRALAGGGPDWLVGDYSLADVGFAPYLTRLDKLQLGAMWDKRPRVADWYERMQARPAYKTAISDWFDYDKSWIELMIEKGSEVKDGALAILAGD